MTHQADTIRTAVTRAGVGVGGNEHGHTVQVANFTITDGVIGTSLTNERLLSVTSKAHQRVAARRRDDEETTVHRNVIVIKTLNRATNRSVRQSSGVRGRAVVRGRAIRTDVRFGRGIRRSVIVRANSRAVERTTQADQVGINLTSQSVASIFRVERTQRRQSLDFNDVFDQAAVFVVLVDQDLHFRFRGGNQGNSGRSSFGRGRTTGGRRNVNGVTFLAFVVHTLDQVGRNKVFLVCSHNLVTPNLRNEGCCGSNGYGRGRKRHG